jgi:UDP-N-acetylmuramoyl-tripeptide--D-alanyl-D-alanine ligase
VTEAALPRNRARFTLAEIAEATGGAVLGGDGALAIEGVSTDTRALDAGGLFVALRGERFDGHDHVGAAFAKGAKAVLVEASSARPVEGPAVRVASTRRALGALGRAQRRRFGGRLVGVAGSAGKTTTKSAIAAVLERLAPGAVHHAPGNFNNDIGVPLVLLGLAPSQRYAVVEIGTNAPGEVAELTALAEPDLGVLTLIAIEHAEGLGDLDGVEREEAALFAGMSPDGVALGNGDDARVRRSVEGSPCRERILYGAGADCAVRLVSQSPAGAFGQRLTVEGRFGRVELDVPLPGRAGAYAALAAIAAAEVLGGAPLDGRALEAALSRAGEPGRLIVHELADGTVVLDDAYNANPASVLASVATASEIAARRAARLVLVIGEMRELGALSEREHRRVGDALAESGAARLFAVAGDAALYAEAAARRGMPVDFAETADAALGPLKAGLEPGDVVLVKASRGVRADRIVEGLIH